MRRHLLQVALSILATGLLLRTELQGQHSPAVTSPAQLEASLPSPSVPSDASSGSSLTNSSSRAHGKRNLTHRTASRAPRRASLRSSRHAKGRVSVGSRRRSRALYGGYVGPAPYGSGLTLSYLIPYGDGQNNMVRSQPVNYVHEPVSNYGPGNPQMAANAPPRFRAAYEEQINVAPTHAEPITTLIFKDGRPPVQVQNYALTTSILYA